MPALTPTELAAALYCRGERPINADRVTKAIRHLESREDVDTFLGALPEDVRAQVAELAESGIRQKLKR
jgi:hypothetical protein